MIKRRQEMTVQPRFEVKGGKGPYDTTHIFTTAELDKVNLFAVNTLPPGSSIGVHQHNSEGEAYVILQGQATVSEDGQDFLLGPGDAYSGSVVHSRGVANDSDEVLVFLALLNS